MLRQIFRYCKPQNLELCIKHQPISTFNILNVNRVNYLQYNLKSFYTSSPTKKFLFVDHENIFAFDILLKDPLNKPRIKTAHNEITSLEEFNEILDQNWRDSNIGEIVDTFLKVKNLCVLNHITVSDTRFDKLVDGLMDNCEYITDEELINLLYCLGEFPLTEAYSSHNMHDIWSCLDDICCWKIVDWDIDKCFSVANAWYKLHLGRLCDYIFILLDRFTKKAEKLTKEQLINIFFYLNVCRKRPVDFGYEFALERLVNEMDIDEMAVVAMGYFKTKTKIKLPAIHEAMINRVIENTTTVHDISLTAILKILRYSKPIKISSKIEVMTEKLYSEVDRLSDLCCTHLALLSTGIQTYNKDILQKVSEKFLKQISNVQVIRIKDIERMLNVLTMFNYHPKTEPDIFKACFDELHRKDRLEELEKYPRCLICAMNYLSLRNIYSYELLNIVLDKEYIESNFGKGAKSIPRELFSLDTSIDIECPGYIGSRLSPLQRYKSVKWLTEYTPTHDQWKKLTSADKLILDTIDTVKAVVGDEKLMYISHILPHFSRADIVVCKNKKTGQFVQPTGFQNFVFGDIKFPFNDGSLEWIAIIVLGWNNTIKDINVPLGHSIMKERQLRKIGYTPVFVIWSEFLKLSHEKRKEYISHKLR